MAEWLTYQESGRTKRQGSHFWYLPLPTVVKSVPELRNLSAARTFSIGEWFVRFYPCNSCLSVSSSSCPISWEVAKIWHQNIILCFSCVNYSVYHHLSRRKLQDPLSFSRDGLHSHSYSHKNPSRLSKWNLTTYRRPNGLLDLVLSLREMVRVLKYSSLTMRVGTSGGVVGVGQVHKCVAFF